LFCRAVKKRNKFSKAKHDTNRNVIVLTLASTAVTFEHQDVTIYGRLNYE
jgi:hypothetical protein